MLMVAERAQSAGRVAGAVRSRGRPSLDAAAQIEREILDAALDLFFTQGYGQTSMAMVVKAAGVSKTTLYARYATKADLFQAIVRRIVEVTRDDVQGLRFVETTDLVEGLHAYGWAAIIACMSPLWIKYERLVYSEGSRFPEIVSPLLDRLQIARESIARFIRECAARDGIPVRDADAVSHGFLMALRGFFSVMAVAPCPPDNEETERFLSNLVRLTVSARESW